MEGAESGPLLRQVLTTAKAEPGARSPDEAPSVPQSHRSKALPQSGLSFPMTAVSKSALKLAMLMAISSLLS